MFWEFLAVVSLYMFVINFVMKKVGGNEMKVLDKDIKKNLEAVKAGNDDAMDKLNNLNKRRMKLAMKSQLYLLPIVLPAIWFIKNRYAEFQMTILGHSLGWLGSFFILGIPASILSDKLVKKLLNYS